MTNQDNYFYNDCFFRNIYKYKYVVILDTDEIIIPNTVLHWKDMVKVIQKNRGLKQVKAAAGLVFRQTLFLDRYLTVRAHLHIAMKKLSSKNCMVMKKYIWHFDEALVTTFLLLGVNLP